ncbi:MAG: TIGR02452 family protein [Firmicutes bacterium]|nr:TIGR02452 family protein [Bacillota bacterium]
MTEQLSDEEKMKRLAAKMREAEYKGLSDAEIRERERQKAERTQRNIGILDDTLNILKAGGYQRDGQEVRLRLSPEKMRQIQVFLPSDIDSLRDSAKASENQAHGSSCIFGCENIDTLALAEKRYRDLKAQGISEPKILVLNMASSTRPGGRVRDGAAAQEEELCRRTSLLLSLESEEAKSYYEYNTALKTHMASDAVMMSANVEVIKDSASELLNEPFEIAVMSCAAPMVRLGLEGMSGDEYRDMLYKRICGMLLVAAAQGYRHLILGAFGCGVFGNDAAVVSDLFYRAFRELSDRGHMFDSVDFAVLCRADNDRNYREFCRSFSCEQK